MTAKREAANRANSKRSTGPHTTAGKAISSRNSTKHGLTAATALLPSENAADFAALEAAISSNYTESPFVVPLIHQLASIMWRLARLRRIEALSLLVHFGGRMSQGVEDPKFGHTFRFEDLAEEIDTYTTVERKANVDITSISVDLFQLSRYEASLFNQMMRLLKFLEPYALAKQIADSPIMGNGLALQAPPSSKSDAEARPRDNHSVT